MFRQAIPLDVCITSLPIDWYVSRDTGATNFDTRTTCLFSLYRWQRLRLGLQPHPRFRHLPVAPTTLPVSIEPLTSAQEVAFREGRDRPYVRTQNAQIQSSQSLASRLPITFSLPTLYIFLSDCSESSGQDLTMKSESVVHRSELTELTSAGNHRKAKSSRQLLKLVREADWWVWEVLSLVISAIALAAIVIFLASLDDKPQPLWASAGRYCVTIPGIDRSVCRRSGITVNSIVSWLGTLARICVLVPLSNGLGQLKWAWFSDGKGRPLADLDTFDAASRGVVGSVQLIFLLKARYFKFEVLVCVYN